MERAYSRYERSARKRRAWSDNPGNRAAHDELKRALGRLGAPELEGGGPVLDVGCGTGAWIRELSAQVDPDRLYGLDAIAGRLALARQAVPAAHFAHADARDLPFDDGAFALVLLFTVLTDMPSVEDVRRVVAESRRVLRPGGLLAIYEPRVPNPFNSATRAIHTRDLALPVRSRTLTLLPPLARRLGRRTPQLYPLLASIAPLRTHRLWWHRKDEAPGSGARRS